MVEKLNKEKKGKIDQYIGEKDGNEDIPSISLELEYNSNFKMRPKIEKFYSNNNEKVKYIKNKNKYEFKPNSKKFKIIYENKII